MATEKRLIDANEVERKIRLCIDSWSRDCNSNAPVIARTFKDALDRVVYAPTVDAVEVVRCKDCKYNEDCIRRIQFWGRNPVLELNTSEYHPLDFCSYGERKDNA